MSQWINFLKGIAIFEIVMFHFFADNASLMGQAAQQASLSFIVFKTFIKASHIGSQGIHIFFFLSGFGIALSEQNRKLSFTDFIVRRVLKIYPAYFVAVLFVVTLKISTSQIQWSEQFQTAFLANIFLISNYSVDWIKSINGNWWFIGSLMPMYVLHTFIRNYIYKYPLYFLPFSLMCSLLYKVLLIILLEDNFVKFDAGELNPYTSFFLNYWWEFVAGVVSVKLGLWDYLEKLSQSKLYLVFFIGAVFETIGIFLGNNAIGRIFNDDLFMVAQILLLSFVFLSIYEKNGAVLTQFSNVFQGIGVSSYGLYLIHHPISHTLIYYDIKVTVLYLFPIFVLYFIFCLSVGKIIENFTHNAMQIVSKIP